MYSMKYILFFIILKLEFGKSKPTLRSVGGRDALDGEFPFIVSLQQKLEDMEYSHICTGSALTATWGLTAAHCLTGEDEDDIKAVWRTSSGVNHVGESEIASLVSHPRYYESDEDSVSGDYHDIALFETKRTMDVVAFAKLSAFDYVSVDGLKAFSVGYGIRNVTESDTTLQVVEGMLSGCGEMTRNLLTPSICLKPLCSVRAGGASSTPGDSGGPVVHPTGIVGVLSRGIGIDAERNKLFATPESPTGIVNVVSPYLNWISDVIFKKHSELSFQS